MKIINPKKNPVEPTPDHTNVTSQEIAGKLAGTKSCDVKLGVYEPGGDCISHAHPHSEHVFYILEGQLTAIDEDGNEITAYAEEALFIPAAEVHRAVNRGETKTMYIAVTSPPTG